LLFGGAGYALHGRPDLAGSPAIGTADSRHLPLAKARHALLGQFTSSERWLILSDSFAARGETEDAVGLVQSGLRAHPDDYSLWVGLGNALVDHAGVMTPAAELAYRRAEKLAPWSPAPKFFRGLARLRSGEREAALAEWQALLASAPAEAEWRPLVEDGVAMIERGQAAS
jgi:cytochrome c-type biogenesis protein CcmH